LNLLIFDVLFNMQLATGNWRLAASGWQLAIGGW
jgi:hypothetical protein